MYFLSVLLVTRNFPDVYAVMAQKIFDAVVCLFILSCALCEAKNVTFSECDDEETNCDVHGVWISACSDAYPDVCTIEAGQMSEMGIDFTPKFSSKDLAIRLYWHNGRVDLPFVGIDSDACKHTQCPIEPNQRRVLTDNILVSKKYPAKLFNIKWKIWDNADEEQQCCVYLDFKIIKP